MFAAPRQAATPSFFVLFVDPTIADLGGSSGRPIQVNYHTPMSSLTIAKIKQLPERQAASDACLAKRPSL